MALYFADTEITGIKDLFPLSSKDITNVYFADTELFTVWGEYDGTLPAQYSANGDYLADYRVYGNAGGVGDETDNLFDKNADDASNGYVNNAYIRPTPGNIVQSSEYFVSEYIPISKTLSSSITIYERDAYVTTAHNAFYDVNKTLLYTFYNQAPSRTVTVPDNARYIRLSVKKSNTDSVMVSYQNNLISYTPFGYKLDMSVQIGELLTDITQGGWDGANGRKTTHVTSGSFYPIRLGLARYYIEPQKTYTISVVPKDLKITIKTADAENIQIHDTGWSNVHTIITGSNANNLCIAIRKSDNSNITPTDVQCVKIITSETTTTPIYIGDTPLGEDEYVDYGEQKIYRMSGGVLTPTDPPAPLPALPTVDGTNIVDYVGQSVAVPSRFYAKYMKEGFK